MPTITNKGGGGLKKKERKLAVIICGLWTSGQLHKFSKQMSNICNNCWFGKSILEAKNPQLRLKILNTKFTFSLNFMK